MGHRFAQSKPILVVTPSTARLILGVSLFLAVATMLGSVIWTGRLDWETLIVGVGSASWATSVMVIALWYSQNRTSGAPRNTDAVVDSPLPNVLFSARPSFIEGAARILDFGNTLDDPRPSLGDAEQDRLAFRLDWMELGLDLAACELSARRRLDLSEQIGTWLMPVADKRVQLPFGYDRR
jgi:hypothetical protein